LFCFTNAHCGNHLACSTHGSSPENRDATITSKSNQSSLHESQTNSSEDRHIVGNIEDAEGVAVSKSQHNYDYSTLGINIEKPKDFEVIVASLFSDVSLLNSDSVEVAPFRPEVVVV
jgi:hypothetical protein